MKADHLERLGPKEGYLVSSLDFLSVIYSRLKAGEAIHIETTMDTEKKKHLNKNLLCLVKEPGKGQPSKT